MVINMQKKIILVAGSVSTKDFLCGQLKEFIPDTFYIEAYASEEYLVPELNCDLLIISSLDMKGELDAKNIKYNCKDIVICERSVNFDYIDMIADIPANQEVLLVNDEKDTTEKSINDLLELGLNHIKYFPYYPSIENYKKLKTAITPGEVDKVPSCVENIINLGPRVIDINTMYTIMDKLEMPHKDTTFITKKYMEKIINVSKRISAINNNVTSLNGYLNNIVNSLVNGIIVYDEDGYIKYANEKMTKLLSTEKNIVSKNIKNIIEKELLPFFLSSDIYENKHIDIRGNGVKVSKFIVPGSQNIVLTTSKDEKSKAEKRYSNDLLLKGYYARYNFDNIIGSSDALRAVKNISLKLSKSELSVLIEGESGTGKELFASAIHNNSSRKYKPFIAVNFSALPDELIESELFGYEEGAFTGAKKGGKLGLFELADGGTIFLDEIGDVSPKVQTKLLRVLQEKQFLPLGGSAIRKVDVRIIAATNKNLKAMVAQKQFRSDLYYRLKVGYVYLPPLRTRKNDIDELVSYFIKMETSADINVNKNVLEKLKKYKWLGNVRELESTIKYMLAVRTANTLTVSDFPDNNFFEEDAKNNYGEFNAEDLLNYDNESLAILGAIKFLHDNNISAGREKITQRLNELGYDITESKTRTRLEKLNKDGLVNKKRGIQATVLTEKGLDYLKELEERI